MQKNVTGQFRRIQVPMMSGGGYQTLYTNNTKVKQFGKQGHTSIHLVFQVSYNILVTILKVLKNFSECEQHLRSAFALKLLPPSGRMMTYEPASGVWKPSVL